MANHHSELGKRLWDAADDFRANSKLKSAEYSVSLLKASTHRATAAFLFPILFLATATGQSRLPNPKTELTVSDVVSQSSGAVVQIVVSNQAGTETALGSGFIVSADGKIVTNFHVIKGAHSAVVRLSNGSSFAVEGVLAIDKDRDLALLQIEGESFRFLHFSAHSDVRVGDHVVAIGSPLGLEGSVSDGIVSALRGDKPDERWIQTTAPVSHGSSGGPLLNMFGDVVGVITWGVSAEEGQSLNFAIPSDTARILTSSIGEMRSFDSINGGHEVTSVKTEDVTSGSNSTKTPTVPSTCTNEPGWRPSNSYNSTIHVNQVNANSVDVTIVISRYIAPGTVDKNETIDSASCEGDCSRWTWEPGKDYSVTVYEYVAYIPECLETSKGWVTNRRHTEFPASRSVSINFGTITKTTYPCCGDEQFEKSEFSVLYSLPVPVGDPLRHEQ